MKQVRALKQDRRRLLQQLKPSRTHLQDLQPARQQEQDVDAIKAHNAALKQQLARICSEAAATETQIRTRLEKQFAQHLSAAVAAEVEKALQHMQGQIDLDFEHYYYLRQQHGHVNAEAKDLRERLGAANELARSLLHEVTLCSMEAFLVHTPGDSDLQNSPIRSNASRDAPATPPAPSERCSGGHNAGVAVDRTPCGSAHEQIARRALAFIMGRVDLSSVAHALHGMVQDDGCILPSPSTTPRGQTPGAAGSSFSRRFIHYASPNAGRGSAGAGMPLGLARVVASSLEDLKRFKREHATEQRAVAALHFNREQAEGAEGAEGEILAPLPRANGSPELLSSRGLEHAKRRAEAWAQSTIKSMREFNKSCSPYQASSSVSEGGTAGKPGGPQDSDPDSSDSSDDSSKNSQGEARCIADAPHALPKAVHSQLMGKPPEVLWPPARRSADAVDPERGMGAPPSQPKLLDVSSSCVRPAFLSVMSSPPPLVPLDQSSPSHCPLALVPGRTPCHSPMMQIAEVKGARGNGGNAAAATSAQCVGEHSHTAFVLMYV